MIDIILSVIDLCRYINLPLVNGRVYTFLPILTCGCFGSVCVTPMLWGRGNILDCKMNNNNSISQ